MVGSPRWKNFSFQAPFLGIRKLLSQKISQKYCQNVDVIFLKTLDLIPILQNGVNARQV